MHQCPTCPEFRRNHEPNRVMTLKKEHAGFVAMGRVCCADCYVLIYNLETYVEPHPGWYEQLELPLRLDPG